MKDAPRQQARCQPHPVCRADPRLAHPDALPRACAWSSLPHATFRAGQQVTSRVAPPEKPALTSCSRAASHPRHQEHGPLGTEEPAPGPGLAVPETIPWRPERLTCARPHTLGSSWPLPSNPAPAQEPSRVAHTPLPLNTCSTEPPRRLGGSLLPRKTARGTPHRMERQQLAALAPPAPDRATRTQCRPSPRPALGPPHSERALAELGQHGGCVRPLCKQHNDTGNEDLHAVGGPDAPRSTTET